MAPPPGYVAYGGYGAVQGRPQNIGGLTKWLVGLLAVSLLASLLSVIVQLSLRGSARDFIAGRLSNAQFDDKFALFATAALALAAAGIASTVLLIVWTFRMAKNLQVLGRRPQAFSPGATIAVNLLGGCTLGILPYFMWRELWQGSDPETAPGDPSWKQRAVGAIVTVHLVLTLASVALSFSFGVSGGFGSFQGAGNADDLAKKLDDKFGLLAATGLLSLAASAAFLVLVRQLSARHMRATREA